MRLTIYKYEISPSRGFAEYRLPKGARLLSVDEQYNRMVVYAAVDPLEKEQDVFNFFVFGTGHPFTKPDATFLGTVKMLEGKLMFHVFYQKKGD